MRDAAAPSAPAVDRGRARRHGGAGQVSRRSSRTASWSRQSGATTPTRRTTKRSSPPGSACWWAAPMFASNGARPARRVGDAPARDARTAPGGGADPRRRRIARRHRRRARSVPRRCCATRRRTTRSPGLPNRDRLVERLREITERGDAPTVTPRCSSSTSTGSRSSTTAWATTPATGSSSSSGSAFAARCVTATPWPGSAATSSWSVV